MAKALLSSSKPPFLLPSKPHHHHPPRVLTTRRPHLLPAPRASAKGFTGSRSPPSAAVKKLNPNGSGGGRDDDELPQAVIERMGVRIMFSVGIPVAIGIGLLNLFGELKERNVVDVPLWVPFSTTLLFFGGSALGIVYGALSSSWDLDRKGTVLGFEEFEKNWGEMWKEEEEEEEEDR